jgi:hypothetical protein
MLPVDLSSVIPPRLFEEGLLVATAIGICAMGADETSALIGYDRISERDLALISFFGGFAGDWFPRAAVRSAGPSGGIILMILLYTSSSALPNIAPR